MNSRLKRDRNGTAYELHGPQDAPVIALIHGLGLTRSTWAGLIPALATRYRIVNYDLYGHGESGPPPETPSLTMFSEQLRYLLDELSADRAAVIGFSLGGMINRRFAMDYPDRVTALGILNSPHERGEELQKRVEQQAKDSAAAGPGATLEAAIERWFKPAFISANPGIIREVRRQIMANDPEIYAQSRWVLAAGVSELIRPDPSIAQPSLVTTCENDTGSTPAMSHAIASEIKGAETIIIPELRHMALVEQPELFTAPLLDFLDRHLSDSRPGTLVEDAL